MFQDYCTIYNHYTDPQTKLDQYQRTVLRGVFWDSAKGANIRKSGMESADSVTLIIPKRVRATGQYMKPKEWQRLADKTGYWTLQPGDRIVKGIVETEIEKVSSELDKQYDDVLTITNVDEKQYGGNMAHWEVGGK